MNHDGSLDIEVILCTEESSDDDCDDDKYGVDCYDFLSELGLQNFAELFHPFLLQDGRRICLAWLSKATTKNFKQLGLENETDIEKLICAIYQKLTELKYPFSDDDIDDDDHATDGERDVDKIEKTSQEIFSKNSSSGHSYDKRDIHGSRGLLENLSLDHRSDGNLQRRALPTPTAKQAAKVQVGIRSQGKRNPARLASAKKFDESAWQAIYKSRLTQNRGALAGAVSNRFIFC
jgi:hypothetical protein